MCVSMWYVSECMWVGGVDVGVDVDVGVGKNARIY